MKRVKRFGVIYLMSQVVKNLTRASVAPAPLPKRGEYSATFFSPLLGRGVGATDARVRFCNFKHIVPKQLIKYFAQSAC